MSGAGERISITRLTEAPAYVGRLAEDVRAGLGSAPKTLPSKYFYDAHGSQLFERITRLDEYYLTRRETEILEREAEAIMEAARPSELFEIGSGSSRKTRILLEAMHRVSGGDRYVPLDVSEAALRAAAAALAADYPWLTVAAIRGDLRTDLAAVPRRGARLVIFLGSTIGNLLPDGRTGFYRRVRRLLVPGDRLLVGYDLVKETAVIERAYNDAEGVTAEFNRNILAVINRDLGASFDLDAFEHVSRYDESLARIESGLRARRAMTVPVPGAGLDVTFDAGEIVRTEISAKFTMEAVTRETRDAGLELEAWLTDAAGWFALGLFRSAGESKENGR